MARVFQIFKTRHALRWWEVLFLVLVVVFATLAAGRDRTCVCASEAFGVALPEGTVGYWLQQGMISPEQVHSPMAYLSPEKVAEMQEKAALEEPVAVVAMRQTPAQKTAVKAAQQDDGDWLAIIDEALSQSSAAAQAVSEPEIAPTAEKTPVVEKTPVAENLPAVEKVAEKAPKVVPLKKPSAAKESVAAKTVVDAKENVAEAEPVAAADAKAELAKALETVVEKETEAGAVESATHPLLAPNTSGSALAPLESWTAAAKKDVPQQVKDYSCLIVKTERVGGKLREEESIYAKIRHEPYSVYLRFAKPKKSDGREAIFVAGRNDGKLVAHGSGFERMFGSFWLKPDSPQAMDGNLHPITENGVLHILEQMHDICVKQQKNAAVKMTVTECKLNGRECLRLEILNPTAKTTGGHYLAHFYIDRQRDLPVRYAYWNAANELQEERTYLELKLNPGFTDADFNHQNKAYNF